MTNQDDNNQEIEKVEDVEVETTKKTSDSNDKKQNDDEYELYADVRRVLQGR